jgi:hypothetical protein
LQLEECVASLQSLLGEFSKRDVVPIDVDEVVDAMVALGVKDEFYFWGVEIDDHRLRGALVHWQPWDYPSQEPGKDANLVADIYYAKSLGKDWQRLVCCKELLHVLEPEVSRTNTPEKVQTLIDKIVLAPELQDVVKDGIEASTDGLMLYVALALLFPFSARELLLADSIKRTPKEVALMVDLPERYVALVMHESWADVYKALREWNV